MQARSIRRRGREGRSRYGGLAPESRCRATMIHAEGDGARREPPGVRGRCRGACPAISSDGLPRRSGLPGGRLEPAALDPSWVDRSARSRRTSRCWPCRPVSALVAAIAKEAKRQSAGGRRVVARTNRRARADSRRCQRRADLPHGGQGGRRGDGAGGIVDRRHGGEACGDELSVRSGHTAVAASPMATPIATSMKRCPAVIHARCPCEARITMASVMLAKR
jgi:hypothetical protein